MALLDEVIDACDIDPAVALDAVRRALGESGRDATNPSPADLRHALPALRRALEKVITPGLAYDAVERIDILLALKAPEASNKEHPSLAELTQKLREANQRMSTRDYQGEIAEVEASPHRRRSIAPSSR